MSSVLVKGMKMPESCGTCFVGDRTICKNGCPLGALPDKHGRLIDENDVIDAIHERLHELQMHKEFIKKRGDIDLLGILPYIAKIQTIIEAEGKG